MTQAMWRGVRAKLLAAEGEHAAAEALAREAVALIGPTDLLNDHADVLLDLRRGPPARRARRGGGMYQGARRGALRTKGNRVSAARARSWPAVPAPA